MQLVSHVGFEARVVHPLNQRVRFQPPRDGHCVLLLLLHAQRHRLQPTKREPAVEGTKKRALRVLVKVNLFRELLSFAR